jgi:hypothetical protein
MGQDIDPVAAVTLGGHERVRTGSTIATLGRSLLSEIPFFRFALTSVRMEDGDTSEPVPAVVGMATIGATGPGTLTLFSDENRFTNRSKKKLDPTSTIHIETCACNQGSLL